jgi:hypothetical protein
MANKNSGNQSGGKKERVRKSPEEAQKAIVGRVRKVIGKATAQLQAAQIRASGRPGGNPALIAAYEAFDKALVDITAPKTEGK